MKIVTLFKMSLIETYSSVNTGKNLRMNFLFRMVWNKEMS